MKLAYEFSPQADRRVVAIDAWWQAHGDDPSLFRRELDRAIVRLRDHPDVGAIYETKRSRRQVRRVLLPKSSQWLYYTVDRTKHMLRIVTLCGTSRKSQPKL